MGFPGILKTNPSFSLSSPELWAAWSHASVFLQVPDAWELVMFRSTGLWPRSLP